jgi:epoxyqueuosine reductase
MSPPEQSLKAAARTLGFALVGFARLHRLNDRAPFVTRWLDEGRAAGMDWLARDPERRFDPRQLDPRLRSVISLAYPYPAPAPPAIDWQAELRGRIAAYALGPDYHDLVLGKARVLADHLHAIQPGAVVRAYVDTGPVLEREWAAEAGLGWFGRNTNLLNRHHGSYFFLAEIFTDVEFDSAVEPYREHCGSCRECLDRCPTQALADGYLLDPRLCISYLTIEHRGVIPLELRPRLGKWIFGCDICQEVCPWNGDAARAASPNEDLAPSSPNEDLAPSLIELMMLDDAGFRRRYGKTAVARTKRRGLLRNAVIALGNSANPAAVPILAQTLEHEPEALVREHAAWALARFAAPQARDALMRARAREAVAGVKREIDQALAQF